MARVSSSVFNVAAKGAGVIDEVRPRDGDAPSLVDFAVKTQPAHTHVEGGAQYRF